MFTEPLPAHLTGPLRAFEEALVDVRTRQARLDAVVIPDPPGPSAEDFEKAAARPDAPPELRAMARAVQEGRADWEDVLTGRVGAAPEVAALHANGAERFAAFWERGEAEDERRAEEARQAAEEARRG